MDTAQPSELACPPQEPESHNEAQDLLLLQDYVCKLSHTQRTLEDTYALLQQTELLAGVINEQDCRAIRTACCCLKSLRIRVEARANVIERAVIGRQLQLMQASVQHYPTENLNTADTSCPSRTSAEHFDNRPRTCPENERSHPCTNVAEPATWLTDRIEYWGGPFLRACFFLRFKIQKGPLLCHIVLLNFHSLEVLKACREACPDVFCSNFHGLATLEFKTCIEARLQLCFIL